MASDKTSAIKVSAHGTRIAIGNKDALDSQADFAHAALCGRLGDVGNCG